VKGKEGDVICHSGGTGGYRTFAGFVKETGMGVVVFTNSAQGAPEDIGFHLLNSEAPLKEIKANITTGMSKLIEAKNIDGAIAFYKEQLKTNPAQYDFSENSLNTFGYNYMESNLPAALAIFKLNAEQNPNSANVYDSYGEALLKSAIVSYKKSVEINPGNASGIAALEKLGEKPATSNAIVVSETTLDTYIGVYEFVPGFSMAVTREGKQLFAQATNQARFEIFPKSQTEFFLKVVEAQVIFNVVDGKVETLTLNQGGRQMNAKRVK
jgi:tetratricopeptide (TPR) repeat protein